MKKEHIVFGIAIGLSGLVGIPCLSFSEVVPTDPPPIRGYNTTSLDQPIGEYPSGSPLSESSGNKAKFMWAIVNKAKEYELWILPSVGPSILKIFKATGDANLKCERNYCTTSEIELPSREGQWAVRALDETKTPKQSSIWSASKFFGTLGDTYARCIKPLDSMDGYVVEVGDLPWTRNLFGLAEGIELTQGEWTVGLAALAQIVKYDFAKKRAGFNTGLGAGASFRFYRDVYVPGVGEVPISRVNSDCRASTFKLRSDTDLPDAGPVFSLTPALFASQLTGENNLRVEPAILLGFFEDIVNVGVGFNLTGEDGDVGDVFLLFGVGAGFNF